MKYSCERWSNKRIYKTEIVIVRWTKPTQLELQALIPLNYNYADSGDTEESVQNTQHGREACGYTMFAGSVNEVEK